MEGRAPQGSSRSAAPTAKRSRIVWIIGAVAATLLLIIALLSFAWNGHDDALDAHSQAPESGMDAAVGAEAAPAHEHGAAMIVDASADQTVSPTPVTEGGGTATDGAAPATAAAATANTPAATASTTRPRTQRQPAATKDKQRTDDDLLGTLLGIIKDDRKEAPKHESMDSLIAKIQADDKRNTADADAAFDSIDHAKGTASTGSEIQAQLRRCPKANTLEGIECRRRICAAHTGTDPACPAH